MSLRTLVLLSSRRLQLQAATLDEQAVAGFFLGHFFGSSGGFRHFMV